MNKVIFLVLWLVGFCCLACNSLQPAKNCQQFHTGDFTYHFHSPNPRESFSFSVTRRGNIQTETNQQSGAVSRFTVKWLTACSYELHLLESTEHYPKEIEELRRKSPLRTEILSSTTNYYLFRSQRAGSDFMLTDTIWFAK